VKVEGDTKEGFVSVESAGKLYGVVLAADGLVDEQATSALRAEMRAERQEVH
jgi:hypothetical protein